MTPDPKLYAIEEWQIEVNGAAIIAINSHLLNTCVRSCITRLSRTRILALTSRLILMQGIEQSTN